MPEGTDIRLGKEIARQEKSMEDPGPRQSQQGREAAGDREEREGGKASRGQGCVHPGQQGHGPKSRFRQYREGGQTELQEVDAGQGDGDRTEKAEMAKGRIPVNRHGRSRVARRRVDGFPEVRG